MTEYNHTLQELNKESEVGKENKKKTEFEQVKVIKVIDGDTFIISDGRRVRLIGVNTPEFFPKLERNGKEAKNYTTIKLLGKSIWMQRDVSDVDCYSRLLRIIWTQKPENDRDEQEIREKMFNAQLILDGFAEVATFFPDVKYSDYFHCFASRGIESTKVREVP